MSAAKNHVRRASLVARKDGNTTFGRIVTDGAKKGRGLDALPRGWKKLPLRAVLSVRKNRNHDLEFEKDSVLSVSGEMGVTNQIELLGRSFAGVSVANYRVIEHGDIVYTKSPLKANPYGIIKQNKGTRGIVSPLYAVYECPSETLGAYLDFWFESDERLNNYLRPLVRRGPKNTLLIDDVEALSGFIDVPPSGEIERIVLILSSCDRVIELKRKLLEGKKAQKRALMQLLLEPKGGDAAFSRVEEGGTRPGGRISRTLVPLSTFLDFKNGINAPKEQFGSGIKLISVREVLDEQPIRYDSIRASVDVPAEMVEAYSVDFGDVLFQRSSENAQEAGSCNVYVDTKPAVFGGFVIRGKKKANFNPVFFRALLQSRFVRRQIVAKAAGAQHFNVGQEDLESIMVPVFGQEEQDRIASVLSAADREIDGLAREVEEWKEKKKALSQLLLSGKVRV